MTSAHGFKPLQYFNRLVHMWLLPPRVPPLARLGLVPQKRESTTSGTLSCGCAGLHRIGHYMETSSLQRSWTELLCHVVSYWTFCALRANRVVSSVCPESTIRPEGMRRHSRKVIQLFFRSFSDFV